MSLKAGEARRVSFTLAERDLSHVDDGGRRLVSAGRYGISVGGGQPGTGAASVAGEFEITGQRSLAR